MKSAYQDQLTAGARQIEFIAGKQTEPKVLGRPKHKIKPVVKSEGLDAWGVPKPGQKTL